MHLEVIIYHFLGGAPIVLLLSVHGLKHFQAPSIPATYTADMDLPKSWFQEIMWSTFKSLGPICGLPSRSFQWNKSDQNDQIVSSNHNLHDFWGGVKQFSYPLFNLNPPFQASKGFWSQDFRQNPKIVTSKRCPKGKKKKWHHVFFEGESWSHLRSWYYLRRICIRCLSRRYKCLLPELKQQISPPKKNATPRISHGVWKTKNSKRNLLWSWFFIFKFNVCVFFWLLAGCLSLISK